MTTATPGLGGPERGTLPDETSGDVEVEPVRRALVERIGTELSAGTYDPPIEGVVDSLVMILLPAIRVGR